jgi:hypothetical protein
MEGEEAVETAPEKLKDDLMAELCLVFVDLRQLKDEGVSDFAQSLAATSEMPAQNCPQIPKLQKQIDCMQKVKECLTKG